MDVLVQLTKYCPYEMTLKKIRHRPTIHSALPQTRDCVWDKRGDVGLNNDVVFNDNDVLGGPMGHDPSQCISHRVVLFGSPAQILFSVVGGFGFQQQRLCNVVGRSRGNRHTQKSVAPRQKSSVVFVRGCRIEQDDTRSRNVGQRFQRCSQVRRFSWNGRHQNVHPGLDQQRRLAWLSC